MSSTPAAFTHYWSESTFDPDAEGKLFDHTAGNRFVRAGVTTGNRVFGITVRQGVPTLIGRMTVAFPPLSYEAACKVLGHDIWQADEHLMAEAGTASTKSFGRVIPTDMLKRLRFESASGETALKFVSETRLDQQTFRGVRRLTPASALELDSLLTPTPQQSIVAVLPELPARVDVLLARLQRDRAVVNQLKALYDNRCQLCGFTIELPGGGRYSEGHHVRPLGSEHRGSDTLDNLLCVCPNCHTLLDYGCIAISSEILTIASTHTLNQTNISYHNQAIHGQPING